METCVEKLYNAIAHEKQNYTSLKSLFGNQHSIVKEKRNHIMSMECAFKIITGCSYAIYQFSKNNNA